MHEVPIRTRQKASPGRISYPFIKDTINYTQASRIPRALRKEYKIAMRLIYSAKIAMKTLQVFRSGTVLYSIHVTERISCTFCEIVSRKIYTCKV